MSTQKVLSANDIKRVAGVSKQRLKKIAWHTSEIVVKQSLSMDEFFGLIRDIMHDCTKEDGSVAIEFIDFSMRVNIISAYALVDLPKEPEDLFFATYSSDLYETICRAVNQNQLRAINRAISAYLGGDIESE